MSQEQSKIPSSLPVPTARQTGQTQNKTSAWRSDRFGKYILQKKLGQGGLARRSLAVIYPIADKYAKPIR